MAKVNVECKLPTGLVCELRGHASVTLNGTNTQPRVNQHGAAFGQDTTLAPGVTSVDEKFITAWLVANAHLPMVANGLIAISPTR